MKISVRDVQREDNLVKHVTAQADVASLPAGPEDVPLVAPVEMAAEIYVTEDELLANIRATTTAEVTCSRCLASVSLPLVAPFTEVLRPQTAADGSETEEDDEEHHVTYYSGDEIDLLPLVVENLALALPMKPLCQTDCLGLCPACGQNLNEATCQCEIGQTDPRWAVLGKLWDSVRSDRKGVE